MKDYIAEELAKEQQARAQFYAQAMDAQNIQASAQQNAYEKQLAAAQQVPEYILLRAMVAELRDRLERQEAFIRSIGAEVDPDTRDAMAGSTATPKGTPEGGTMSKYSDYICPIHEGCHVNHVGVHDTHCCASHGCKYGDEDCPVVHGVAAGIICEDCQSDNEKRRHIYSRIAEAVAAEREACAKVAEDMPPPAEYLEWRDDREPEGFYGARESIAAAIRARGSQ